MKLSNQVNQPKKLFLIVISVLTLSACLASAPVITAIAQSFGANLIATAVENYSQEYGKDVGELLTTMVTPATDDNNSSQLNSDAQNQQHASYDDELNYVDQEQIINDAPQSQEQFQQVVFDSDYVDQQWQEADLAMNVDVLVERAGKHGVDEPTIIHDGESLFGHPSDPSKGDKIKISFNANCDCYVYIVSIDSTGYVLQMFPDPQAGLTNPISQKNNYLIPEGNEWYGLDEYTGIEEIYILASKNRRLDLERIIKKLSAQKRYVGSDYKPVHTAAVLPKTRSFVKVSSPKKSIVQSTSGASHAFSPTLFISNAKSAGLAITRWFVHQ